MMAESNYIGRQIQGYTITKRLGGGGYGTVYLGAKEDLGKQYLTAIKHMAMPSDEAYEAVLQDYGYDKIAAHAHFEKLVEGIASEINTLLELSKKDNRHIVAYYDHEIQKTAEPFHVDIYMRMEYLTPLLNFIRQNGFSAGDVIRLALNMCDALMLCHNNDVMHRDIKEANIFVSENGNYKLGDFGVAKTAFEATQAGSIKGTASYMAPEIYLREPYDKTVDIYSLGIVLYKLLNNQRLPFMPDAPAIFTADDKNSAETRRLKGERPPLPFHAKNRLGEIIVKACSVKAERYDSAEAFKKDMAACLASLSVEEYDAVVVPQSADGGASYNSYSDSPQATYTQTQGATMTMGANTGAQYAQATPQQQNPYAKKKRPKKNMKLRIGLIAAAAAIVIGGGFFAYQYFFNNPMRDFSNFLNAENYSSALSVFSTDLQADSRQAEQAGELVGSRARAVADSYIDESTTYEAAISSLEELRKLRAVPEEEIQALIDETNELRLSRVAYETAQEDVSAGRLSDAILELRTVIERDAQYANAQTQLVAVIESYKAQVFQDADAAQSGGAYPEAADIITGALNIIENDADFTARLQTIADAHAGSIVSEAQTLAAQNSFAEALAILSDGILRYPDNQSLTQQVAAVEKADVDYHIREARGVVAAGADYDQAVSLLQGAQRRYPQSAELSAEIASIQSADIASIILTIDGYAANNQLSDAIYAAEALTAKYPTDGVARSKLEDLQYIDIENVSAQADALAAEHKYTQAHNVLGTLLGKYPNNSLVKDKIAALEKEMYPTLQFENALNIGNEFDSLSNAFDNYDNPYGRSVRLSYASYNDRYCQILLDGDYSRFKGTFFIQRSSSNYGYVRGFRIELDGRVVYGPAQMGKSTRPIYVDLNVAGGNDFRIIVSEQYDAPAICLGDAGFFE